MTVNFNLGFVADAAGTVDAITATYTPTYTVLLDKMLVWFRATGANTSATPTFSPNGLTARTIVKQGGQPLVAGDIPRAGAIMEMVYDATNTRWELVNPTFVNPSSTQLLGKRIGVNLNTTADQPISLIGNGRYIIKDIVFTNASIAIDTALDAEIYDSINRGGIAIAQTNSPVDLMTYLAAPTVIMNQSISLQIAILNPGNFPLIVQSQTFTSNTVYFSLGTPQGAAATMDVYVFGFVI